MAKPPQGENNTYLSPSISYLWPHHRKMARLVMDGATPGEIVSLTGFSSGQISRIMGSPHFQAEVNRLTEMAEEIAVDIRKDLNQMASKAIENLDEDLHMEAGTLAERKVRQDASQDILERAGYRRGATIITRDLHLHKHETEAKEMDTKDLVDEVMDLTKTAEGGYK